MLVTADPAGRQELAAALEVNGFRVDIISRFEEACARVPILSPDLILADINTLHDPDLSNKCQKLVRCSDQSPAAAPVIILGGVERFELTAELMEAGANDFLTGSFSIPDLICRIEIALVASKFTGVGDPASKSNSREGHGAGLAPRRARPYEAAKPLCDATANETADEPFDGMLIGRGEAFARVISQVGLVAPKDTTVLIMGETGTGKERVARAIHMLSDRGNRDMVSVNCGGIPANLLEDEFFGHVKGAFTDAHQDRIGRFEQAHRSTIFLDEIGELPLELQPKLLRVIQEREIHPVGGVETVRFDSRIVAATNVDLWSRVQDGLFREDLFYRINVFPIHLPPLRERREDIPLCIDYFMDRFCLRDGLESKCPDEGAEADLVSRHWPGNIRELENAVEIAVIRSQDRRVVKLADFPEPRPIRRAAAAASGSAGGNFKEIVSQFERELISTVLGRTQGNKTRAAEILRLKRTTLVEKLKKLDREPEPATEGWH